MATDGYMFRDLTGSNPADLPTDEFLVAGALIDAMRMANVNLATPRDALQA